MTPEEEPTDEESSVEIVDTKEAGAAAEKKIKYQTFTKHGAHDFAYKNIKSLKAIREKKNTEREIISAKQHSVLIS